MILSLSQIGYGLCDKENERAHEHVFGCLKKRWRQLWHNALEISKGFELQVAKFSNLSLSRVQETETEVETEAEVEAAGR